MCLVKGKNGISLMLNARVVLNIITQSTIISSFVPPSKFFTTKAPARYNLVSSRNHRSGVVMQDVFHCDSQNSEGPRYFGYSEIPYEFYAHSSDSAHIKQYSLVMIQGEGNILLGMKKRGFGQGKYNGFGGKVEIGESIEESAFREFKEETTVALMEGSLTKRAILTFFFESQDSIMQVHLFTGAATSLMGDPVETDEMRPQWFSVDAIPFDSMWADDALWFPWMQAGKNFEGVFLFRGQQEVLSHRIIDMPYPWPAFCAGDGRQLGDIHNLTTIAAPDVLSARAFALREGRDLMLEGERVVLVPYRAEHVATYHAWMQDTELLELTGSEPLSLAEEEDMQRKWANDTDKATFILLERGTPDTPGTGAHGGRMVGDVNLFFYEPDDPCHAELSVMVAVPDARRRGLAREAVCAMMQHGYARLGARRFAAKVDEGNGASLALFDGLGFARESFSAAFRQHTLAWAPTPHQIAACLPARPAAGRY